MEQPSSGGSTSSFVTTSGRTRAALLLVFAVLVTLVAGCGDVTPSRGWPSPVLTGDNGGEQLVVIQSAPGKLTQLAITPAGVAERWTFPGKDDDTNLQAIYATPVVRSGTLIVAAYSKDLIALDVATGRPIVGWGGQLSGRVVADPVQVGPALMFVATDHGAVHPVDLGSGTIFASKLDVGQRMYGAGARLRENVYYGTLDKRLFAIDPTSGAPAWNVPAAPFLSNVATASDTLVIGTLDAHVRAYNAADGSERWAFKGAEWFWATPIVSGGVIYAADLDGRVFALDAATGTERWRSALTRGNVRATPVLASNILVLATTDGLIFALDPATGAELWALQTASGKLLATPLVLESGILFVTDSGALLRVNPTAGTQETLYTPK